MLKSQKVFILKIAMFACCLCLVICGISISLLHGGVVYAESIEISSANIETFEANGLDGYYILTSDVTTTTGLVVAEDKTVTIDLNGFVLNGNGAVAISNNSGTLIIKDTKTENLTRHYFTVGSDGLWTWNGSSYTNESADNFSTLSSRPAENTVVYITGGLITGGLSSLSGGGVSNNGILTVSDCDFVGCIANYGGAIYNNSSYDNDSNGVDSFTIDNARFLGCVAVADGGAIWTVSNTNIYSCDFKFNSATSSSSLGGAVFLGGKCLIEGCNFSYNTAAEGGAINSAYKQGALCTIINTNIQNNTATKNGGGIYVANNGGECVLAGTKITMADGKIKNIEDIKYGDYVKTFDHFEGKLSCEEVCLIHKCSGYQKICVLNFSDGQELKIVGDHALFEKESKKYLSINYQNAQSLVGKEFYNANDNCFVALTNVSFIAQDCEYYALVTKHHLNCITNEMLSIPSQCDFLMNLFEFDENLKIDDAQLQDDIETFGYLPLEDAFGTTSEEYDIFSVKYLNIALGKGLVDEKKIEYVISLFREILNDSNQFEKSQSISMSTSLSITSNNCRTYTSGVSGMKIIIGSSVVVDKNHVGTTENNVQLDENGGICVILNAQESNVGITTSTDPANNAPVSFITGATSNAYSAFSSDKGYSISVSEVSGESTTYTYSLSVASQQESTQQESSVPTSGVCFDSSTLVISISAFLLSLCVFVVLAIKNKRLLK